LSLSSTMLFNQETADGTRWYRTEPHITGGQVDTAWGAGL
jgi:hypothetical protein